MAGTKPMIGKRFGRLIVIERSHCDKHGNALWICKCDCGKNTRPIIGSSLRSGNTRSCGCLNGTHHQRKTRLYSIWCGIKKRCCNPSHKFYEIYGGRGISICDEWKDDFQAFYDWANESGYEESLTIDRIDNDGNYEPSNCRWVTQQEQIRNRSIAIKVSIDGVEKPLQQVADETGIQYRTLYGRYKKGLRGNELIKQVDRRMIRNVRRSQSGNNSNGQ